MNDQESDWNQKSDWKSDEDEDSVQFRFVDSSGNARTRILRGIIAGEDEHFVHLRRRDGDWRIAKSEVVSIRRAVRERVEQ